MTELPDHWGLQRLKYVSQHIVEKRFPIEGDIKVSPENVESNTGRVLDFYSDYNSEGQEFLPGDILFNKLRVYLNKVVLTDFAGLSMGEMIVLRPQEIYPEYLSKVMTSKVVIDEINSLSEGVKLPRPPIEGIMNSFVPVPPPEEQKLISLYLDKKTKQIDSLVEKIQRKIELLKEQQKSLINRCVAKGLDQNVEMKDSGIEWIGEIPKHWGVVRLRYLCDIATGGRDTQDKIEGGNYPFFVRSPEVERIDTWSFDGEAVLTAGDGAVGKIFHYYNGKFDFHQRVYKFSSFRGILGRYFFWFLRENFQYEILRWNAKTTVDSVRLPFLQNFPMVLPPLQEQYRILEKIEQLSVSVDRLTVKMEQKVEFLKEYRQSLISSVVTGKVRITEDMI